MIHETHDEPLFNSVESALIFAFNYSSQAYDRPLIDRMAAPSPGSGKGLSGLDGAAQAGMIRAEVAALGRLSEAILFARFTPRSMPCHCRSSCCSGHKQNKEWTDAVAFLADYVRTTALAGCVSNGLMRRAYVIRHFTEKAKRVSLDELAKKHAINRQTVSAHCSKVATLFAGVRHGKNAGSGLEEVTRAAIAERLRLCGMVCA